MQFGNMGFGSRFDLSKPYQPSLQAQDGQMPGMVNLGASQGLSTPTPSLMDIGQAQQLQPGSLLGFGDTSAMMGAKPGMDYAGLAQGLAGMIGSAGGQEAPQAPPPPQVTSGVTYAPKNDKLDKLLAQYGIDLGGL